MFIKVSVAIMPKRINEKIPVYLLLQDNGKEKYLIETSENYNDEK